MDVHEQLQLLEHLVSDVEHKVGWQVNCRSSQGKKEGGLDKANRFSIKLFESPGPKSRTENITAFAVVHPRSGCLDIVIGKRFFTDAEIERMTHVEAARNSGFVRNRLRWRICQAKGDVYNEAVYWLSVACRPSASCASCNPRNLPG